MHNESNGKVQEKQTYRRICSHSLPPTSSKQIFPLSSRLFFIEHAQGPGFHFLHQRVKINAGEWRHWRGKGVPGSLYFFPCNSREFLPPLSPVMPATDIQTTPKTLWSFFVPSSLCVSVFHYFCQMLFCKCPQTPEVRMSWPSR